jgi:hypothetical protein
VVAVGREPAEVGDALGDELRPPVGQVRRDLDAHAGKQPARLGHQAAHVLGPDGRRPGRRRHVRCDRQAGPPVRLRRVGGDVRGLLAVVAAMRHDVLQDHLLQVAELGVDRGEHLQRLDALLLGLADADEHAGGERDAQLSGDPHHLQARRGLLRRRPLVDDEPGNRRLEHESLRRVDLAQPGDRLARQDAEVGVGEDAALERALAHPHDIVDEVRETKLGQACLDARMSVRRLAGEHEQFLDPAALGVVEELEHLVRVVEMWLMGGELAVLAVAAARAGERQRDVSRVCDAARQGEPFGYWIQGLSMPRPASRRHETAARTVMPGSAPWSRKAARHVAWSRGAGRLVAGVSGAG